MKLRYGLQVLWLIFAALLSGCSKREVPPPPKTQPELLLEIYDAARKQQYNAALLKIQKMRALDPTSIFLSELENTVRFNRLTAVVNAYLQMGKFEEALNALQDYEKQHGYTEATEATKKQLFFIARLDHQIRRIKTARRSDELEKEIQDFQTLTEKTDLSPKIVNFIEKRESDIPVLRNWEKQMTMREIRQMMEECQKAGDRRAGLVLTTVYEMESSGVTDRLELPPSGENSADIK